MKLDRRHFFASISSFLFLYPRNSMSKDVCQRLPTKKSGVKVKGVKIKVSPRKACTTAESGIKLVNRGIQGGIWLLRSRAVKVVRNGAIKTIRIGKKWAVMPIAIGTSKYCAAKFLFDISNNSEKLFSSDQIILRVIDAESSTVELEKNLGSLAIAPNDNASFTYDVPIVEGMQEGTKKVELYILSKGNEYLFEDNMAVVNQSEFDRLKEFLSDVYSYCTS